VFEPFLGFETKLYSQAKPISTDSSVLIADSQTHVNIETKLMRTKQRDPTPVKNTPSNLKTTVMNWNCEQCKFRARCETEVAKLKAVHYTPTHTLLNFSECQPLSQPSFA